MVLNAKTVLTSIAILFYVSLLSLVLNTDQSTLALASPTSKRPVHLSKKRVRDDDDEESENGRHRGVGWAPNESLHQYHEFANALVDADISFAGHEDDVMSQDSGEESDRETDDEDEEDKKEDEAFSKRYTRFVSCVNMFEQGDDKPLKRWLGIPVPGDAADATDSRDGAAVEAKFTDGPDVHVLMLRLQHLVRTAKSVAEEENFFRLFDEVRGVIEDVNEQEAMLLHKAIQGGSLRIVNFLLKEGADPNKSHGTCLRLAAAEGHADILRSLIVVGKADTSVEHYAALRDATNDGQGQIVQVFLTYFANPSTDVPKLQQMLNVFHIWASLARTSSEQQRGILLQDVTSTGLLPLPLWLDTYEDVFRDVNWDYIYDLLRHIDSSITLSNTDAVLLYSAWKGDLHILAILLNKLRFEPDVGSSAFKLACFGVQPHAAHLLRQRFGDVVGEDLDAMTISYAITKPPFLDSLLELCRASNRIFSHADLAMVMEDAVHLCDPTENANGQPSPAPPSCQVSMLLLLAHLNQHPPDYVTNFVGRVSDLYYKAWCNDAHDIMRAISTLYSVEALQIAIEQAMGAVKSKKTVRRLMNRLHEAGAHYRTLMEILSELDQDVGKDTDVDVID